jgi:hypothetical protein
MLFRKLKALREHFRRSESFLVGLQEDVERATILAAQPVIDRIKNQGVVARLSEVEFRAFSQFGDDGIIQYLIHHLSPLPDCFIEFGVQTYRESNTRFLLLNNNWRGLIMDADRASILQIQKEPLYWRNDLTAVSAFIDRDNIDRLIAEHGFNGDLGLLSIDIDGNDYWVWERISVIRPTMVIVEYNSVFGPDLAVTVPYDDHFMRLKAHYSGLFWGASLRAFHLLAQQKGFTLVGCNSAGNNAYFVRKDKIGSLHAVEPREAFVESRFRDSRDQSGELTHLSGSARWDAIADLEVFDVEKNVQAPLRSLRK